MERPPRGFIDETSTQPQIDHFKKVWKRGVAVFGLLTLGAIAYVTTEAITGNLSMSETSDLSIMLGGLYSAIGALHALGSVGYAEGLQQNIATNRS